jgi:N-acetylmuramoyl-L-alanine amidase
MKIITVGKYLIYILIICGFVILSSILIKKNISKNKPEIVATIAPSATVQPFTILIVPGHDTDTDCKNDPKCNSGARYKNIYERDLVVSVANDISSLLSQNPNYKVIVSRNTQVWNPIFADYFANNQQVIIDFKNQHQAADKLLIASGQEKIITDVGNHTTASEKTAIELYGINKWADENNVNLIIHLHFNNSTRKNINIPGPYHGFDIFIPEKSRANALASRTAAEDIYNELQKKFNPETSGNNYNSLYEDSGLIALGSANTLTKPALLIEYAYVYEKMLQTGASQKKALERMAEQTVAGIQDYVDSINSKN